MEPDSTTTLHVLIGLVAGFWAAAAAWLWTKDWPLIGVPRDFYEE